MNLQSTVASVIVIVLVCWLVYHFRKLRVAWVEADRLKAKGRESKSQLKVEMTNKFNEAYSNGDLLELQLLRRKVAVSKTRLFGDDAANLLQLVDTRIAELAAEQSVARVADSRRAVLSQFRQLLRIDDEKVLFEALHRLLVTNVEPIDENFIDSEEWRRLYDLAWTRYDQLLSEQVWELVSQACSDGGGDPVAAYHEVKQLRHDLNERFGDEFDASANADLVAKWNEMVVRFNPHPGWEDFIVSDEYWESFNADGMTGIMLTAQQGDLLSMQFARLLLDDNDEDFNEVIIGHFREKLMHALYR